MSEHSLPSQAITLESRGLRIKTLARNGTSAPTANKTKFGFIEERVNTPNWEQIH